MVSSHLVGEIVSVPSEIRMGDLAENTFKIRRLSTSVSVGVEFAGLYYAWKACRFFLASHPAS